MWESSGSQFFRTTTRIQLEPDNFGQNQCFLYVSLQQHTAKTQCLTLAPSFSFFLEMVFIGSILFTLKMKPDFFLCFCIFFSIYVDEAFVAIRAKCPFYCHFETTYQSINVMKWLSLMQWVWSCKTMKRTTKVSVFPNF